MENIVLSDCDKLEIDDFLEGIKDSTNVDWSYKSKKCIGKRNIFSNAYRYLMYIIWPFTIFMKRKKYNIILGWQQFYAIFFAFYCKLFKVKKINRLVICNFTYKEKKGLIGKLYKSIIKFCICNNYVDYIHVPSENYANSFAQLFSIDRRKIIVTSFGVPDLYEKYIHLKDDKEDYSLALGRSNRDYDFLIDEWKKLPLSYKLYIISDEYKIKEKLPNNIKILNNIVGDAQYKYIINCNMLIIPIKDGNICSGDTVLLTAMSFEKLVIVTKPSTLEEVYIRDGINGISIEKDKDVFYKKILKIIQDNQKILSIGKEARKDYLNKYSRKIMGKKIGDKILDENCNDRT